MCCPRVCIPRECSHDHQVSALTGAIQRLKLQHSPTAYVRKQKGPAHFPALGYLCTHIHHTLSTHSDTHTTHTYAHHRHTHAICRSNTYVYTRRCVPQASTRHRPTRCCPLISASLLMFLDAIPGQIPKILAQNGTATPYREAGRGGSIPTRIPMPRVAQPFLVHRG